MDQMKLKRNFTVIFLIETNMQYDKFKSIDLLEILKYKEKKNVISEIY